MRNPRRSWILIWLIPLVIALSGCQDAPNTGPFVTSVTPVVSATATNTPEPTATVQATATATRPAATATSTATSGTAVTATATPIPTQDPCGPGTVMGKGGLCVPAGSNPTPTPDAQVSPTPLAQSLCGPGTTMGKGGLCVPTSNPPITNQPSAGPSVSRPQPVGWCSLPSSPTYQQSLNWDGAFRIWMSDRLSEDIKREGGACDLNFAVESGFTLNSVAGQITRDGNEVKAGNNLKLRGTRLTIRYQPGPSNGFDTWFDGFEQTTMAGDASHKQLTTGWCTVGGQRSLLLTDAVRIYIPFQTNQALKSQGGTCEVDLQTSINTTVNSVEGTVYVDGITVPRGNGILIKGQRIKVDYDANNASNGFDIWFIGVPPSGFTATLRTLTQNEVTGATSNQAQPSQAAPQPVPAPVAQPAPRPAPVAQPAPVAPKPQPAAGASGSCTINGVQRDMIWDGDKGVLYMDPWVNELKTSGGNCNINAKVAGVVKSKSEEIRLAAGGSWNDSFDANPGSGASFQAS